ncbi:MAG: type VI secretion system-associated FHA domain protein TagH [Aliishimia sp.]
MAISLQFQSTGSIPTNGDPIRMVGESLTMGRSPENDLVLPDPDRVLSKRHCMIEDHNGNVVVVDISTNGTFLNYGKLALGPTPTPLNDGDILSVGPYELLISISSADANDIIADPVADMQVSHGFADNAPSAAELLDAPGDGGDFLDDLLSGRDAPAGPGSVDRSEPDDDGLLPPLGDEDPILPSGAIDPFEGQGASAGMHNAAGHDFFAMPQSHDDGSVIPDDWDDDLLGPVGGSPVGNPVDPFAVPGQAQPIPKAEELFETTQQPTYQDEKTDPLIEPTAPPMATAPPAAEATQPLAPTAPPGSAPLASIPPTSMPPAVGGADAASRAYLKALGADEVVIPDADLMTTMTRMGHVTRQMIEGLREILMTRTSIKSEFRIEQTMIGAGGNNPLKFSINPDQAIEAMVKPKARGYLGATEAAAEALEDIKAHEVATISGMEAALKGVLRKLDPASLEEKLDVGTGFGSMLQNKKARYWEIYESRYAEISDQAENDFQELFAREFARAYQDQLDKLK